MPAAHTSRRPGKNIHPAFFCKVRVYLEVTLLHCFRLRSVFIVLFLLVVLLINPAYSKIIEDSGSSAIVNCTATQSNQIQVSVQVEKINIEQTELDETDQDLIFLDNEPGLEIEGMPVLPFIPRSILIPPQGRVTLHVDHVTTEIIHNLDPVLARIEDNLDQYSTIKAEILSHGASLKTPVTGENGLFPSTPVELGETAILRGYRILNFRVYPVQYNQETGETIVNHEVQFHVEIDGAPIDVNWNVPRAKQSLSAWKAVQALVENPPVAPHRDDLLSANYMFIVPEVEGVDAAIAPLVEWRTRQGHKVSVVHVPNANNRQLVHEAIGAAYESENPVEFVTLIGDAAEADFVVQASNGSGDYDYTTIDGNDPLPDIAIGRISAETLEMLEQIIAKITNYEAAPYMERTDWYKQGAVVAGHMQNGLGSVLVAKYVRKELLELGYTEVRHWYHNEDGEIPRGRQQPFITDCFDWGVSVFHYRAYQHMNSLPIQQLYDLPNRRGRWPAVLAISCNTGDFVAVDGYTEAFLRARGGGVGAIGTATPGTSPQYNNIMAGGVWKGIYKDELYTMGWGLNSGKYELWKAYDGFDVTYPFFMDWNNLMGDPATHVWTDIPRGVVVEHPENLAIGASYLPVHITDEETGADEVGALVCLYKADEIHLTQYTNEAGVAEFDIDREALAEGVLMVTATKHNMHPYLGSVTVAAVDVHVAVTGWTIDDDDEGDSQGNDNGEANPGETIELRLALTNIGDNALDGNMTVSIEDLSGAVEIVAGEVVIEDAPDGGEEVEAVFTLRLEASCPDLDNVPIRVEATHGEDKWTSMVTMEVYSPCPVVLSLPLNGAQLVPGETYDFDITITNAGRWVLPASTVTLSTENDVLAFRENDIEYNQIASGESGAAAGRVFRFQVNPMAIPGMPVELALTVEAEGGFTASTNATVIVGEPADGDPFGPDDYGYYCFDSGDTLWEMAPVYEWIEINPEVDGFDFAGTRLDMDDPTDNADMSLAMEMPFNFQYYGEVFDIITICTNGWAAFGDQSELADFRNRRIGQALGPNAQLAVWWDNLVTNNESAILTYHDVDGGKFIIEWSSMHRLVQGGGALETFQIILYNPEEFPTFSGDGIIAYQYRNVTNEDRQARNDTPFCTIGIGNLKDSDGLEYTYWNTYPAGAKPIENEMAIMFTTATSFITGTVVGTVVDAASGDPLVHANISASRGFHVQTDSTGYYILDLLIGDEYSITAGIDGWNDSTFTDLAIAEDETLTVDFGLLFSRFSISTDHIESSLGENELTEQPFTIANDGNGVLTWSSSRTFIEGESGIGNRVESHVVAPVVNDLDLECAMWVDGRFYVCGQNGQNTNMMYVLDEEMNEVNRFPQVGDSRVGMKDLSYGDSLIWGSGERTIYGFTTEGETVHQIYGPFSNNRSIAFDPEHNYLWIHASNSAIVAIDLDGQRIAQFAPPQLNITGLAYWQDDADNCPLYIMHDAGNNGQEVYKMDTVTGDMYFVKALESEDIGQPGGMFLTQGYGIYGNVIMVLVNDYLNRQGDRIDVWQVGSYKGWMTLNVEEGQIPPQSSQEIILSLTSNGLFASVYEGNINFTHSAQGHEASLNVLLTVTSASAPEDAPLPMEFAVDGAYPNPFNSTTILKYSVPQAGNVDLKVFDLAGRLVASQAQVAPSAGVYTFEINASELPSGVYIARVGYGDMNQLVKIACLK